MLPHSTSSPPDADPQLQQNLDCALLEKGNPPPPIGFGQIVNDLIPLSIGRGAWNGLRIGAIYSALLVPTLTITRKFPDIFTFLLGLFGYSFFGALIGLGIGVLFGLLCGTVTALVSRLRFYPIQSWVPYRLWLGLLNMLLVIGSFVVLAMVLPWFREIFTIYEPGRYERHTFSDPLYIIVTFGVGYGTVLLTWIYSWFHAGILARQYAETVGISQEGILFNTDTDLYDRSFQQRTFGALAKNGSRTLSVVSLGQSDTLRARLVKHMHLAPGMAVCDLMTGDGNMWPHLIPLIGPDGTITAVDFTPEMLARAQKRLDCMPARPTITLHQAHACATGLPNDHFDAVVCAFGLATLTPTQFDNLLKEILRILRPGGIFGFVELSVSTRTRRQHWFDSYLTGVAPSLSQLLGGDPRASLLLREYLTRFDNGHLLLPSFYRHRCIFYYYEFFAGCATAIVGMKDTILLSPFSRK